MLYLPLSSTTLSKFFAFVASLTSRVCRVIFTLNDECWLWKIGLHCRHVGSAFSMLPWVCSVIDHRRRWNAVKTSVIHSGARCEPLFFVFTAFWRHLWSITEHVHGNRESLCYFENMNYKGYVINEFTLRTHSMSPLFLILFPSRQITHGAVSGLASKTARAASAPMRQDCKIDI